MTVDELKSLADASAAVTQPCACAIDTYREWTRVPVDFPESQMRTVGTLVADPYGEPTFAEYHPDGTTNWSPGRPSRRATIRTTARRSRNAPCAGAARCAMWRRAGITWSRGSGRSIRA